jgi:hypothetical protein
MDFQTSSNRGYCESQSVHYYGYNLHAVRSVMGSFDLNKASLHDIYYQDDVKSQMNDWTLLADKVYLLNKYQLDLFESSNIKIETPMLINQHNYNKQPYIFRKSRKVIEMLFSQLCDQFMIRRNLR